MFYRYALYTWWSSCCSCRSSLSRCWCGCCCCCCCSCCCRPRAKCCGACWYIPEVIISSESTLLYTSVCFEAKCQNTLATPNVTGRTSSTRPIHNSLLIITISLGNLHEIVATAVCLFDIEILERKEDLITNWCFDDVLAIEVRLVVLWEGFVLDDRVSWCVFTSTFYKRKTLWIYHKMCLLFHCWLSTRFISILFIRDGNINSLDKLVYMV